MSNEVSKPDDADPYRELNRYPRLDLDQALQDLAQRWDENLVTETLNFLEAARSILVVKHGATDKQALVTLLRWITSETAVSNEWIEEDEEDRS